jgi:hypothetical protein
MRSLCFRGDGAKVMTWSDRIVDEVRRTRDAYAARFNYDLRAIYCDLKEQEKRSGRKVVSYAESATEIDRNKAPQQNWPAATVSSNIPSR